MSAKPTVLSTKKLQPVQKEKLTDYRVDEVAFITVELATNVVIEKHIAFAVFTSQNAVKAVFKESKAAAERFDQVYCVGIKTQALLQQYGIQVAKVCKHSEELAHCIVQEKGIDEIHFFCGNLRRDELPELLRENGISVVETEVYKTQLLPEKLSKNYDGILFFSPSAVKSYIKGGNSKEATAFCIGNTTAVEAIMEFENVYVAETPTVEAVIDLLKDNLK